MNRRTLLSMLPLAMVTPIATPVAKPRQQYVELDIASWNAHFQKTGESLHVYIDGEDVTNRCCFARFDDDLVHGFVEMWPEKDGRIVSPKVRRRGVLEIKPGPALGDRG